MRKPQDEAADGHGSKNPASDHPNAVDGIMQKPAGMGMEPEGPGMRKPSETDQGQGKPKAGKLVFDDVPRRFREIGAFRYGHHHHRMPARSPRL